MKHEVDIKGDNTISMFYAVPFVSNTKLFMIYNYYHCYGKCYKFNNNMMRVSKTHFICALIHLKFFHSLKGAEYLQRTGHSTKQ